MHIPINTDDLQKVIDSIRQELPDLAISLEETLRDYNDPKRTAYVAAAKEQQEEGAIEIDDDASISASEDGAYVQAWLWVSDSEAKETGAK